MSPFRYSEAVMGTVVNFEIRSGSPGAAIPPAAAARAVGEAVEWLHWVDATFSTYKRESEINRLDRGELELSGAAPEVRQILGLCDELGATTHGYFDVSVGGHLDPSGVVKGWALERASSLLAQSGYPYHLVEGGGDVRTHGHVGAGGPAWQVGITHPFRVDALCAVVRIGDAAVATSGIYQRGLHVLDPVGGRPATDLAAVTLIGPELVLTDAYATAALAMGGRAKRWLQELAGYEALVIDSLGRAWETTGFAQYRLTGPSRE